MAHYYCFALSDIFFKFQVINEARDFILQIKDERNKGHVFAPVSTILFRTKNEISVRCCWMYSL